MMTAVSGSVTVGIDIGTTAVKAVAVDDAGEVLARSRVPHRLLSPAPDLLEHDAGRAWRGGRGGGGLGGPGPPPGPRGPGWTGFASAAWCRRSPPSTPGDGPVHRGFSTATPAAERCGRSRPPTTGPRWPATPFPIRRDSCGGRRPRPPAPTGTGRRRRWPTSLSAAWPPSTPGRP